MLFIVTFCRVFLIIKRRSKGRYSSCHRYFHTRMKARHYAIAGFELNKRNELVLYSLDAETFLHELQAGTLQGEVVQTQGSDSALISSPLSQVFAYLNDPANADVFTENARYQRVEQ